MMLSVLLRFLSNFSITSMQSLGKRLKVVKQRHSCAVSLPMEKMFNAFYFSEETSKTLPKFPKGFNEIRAWTINGFQLIKLVRNEPKSFDLKGIPSIFFSFKIFSVQFMKKLTNWKVDQICQTLNSLSLLTFLQRRNFSVMVVRNSESYSNRNQTAQCLKPSRCRLRIECAAIMAKIKNTLHENPLSFAYDQSIGALS